MRMTPILQHGGGGKVNVKVAPVGLFSIAQKHVYLLLTKTTTATGQGCGRVVVVLCGF